MISQKKRKNKKIIEAEKILRSHEEKGKNVAETEFLEWCCK